MDKVFKKSILGGFHKKDVVEYLERLGQEYGDEAKQHRQEISNLEATLGQLRQQLSEAQEVKERLERQLGEMREYSDRLRQENDELQAAGSRVFLEKAELSAEKQKTQRLEGDIKSLELNLQGLVEENTRLLQDKGDLENERDELRRNLSESAADNKDDEKSEELMRRIAELLQEKEALQDELDSQRDMMSSHDSLFREDRPHTYTGSRDFRLISADETEDNFRVASSPDKSNEELIADVKHRLDEIIIELNRLTGIEEENRQALNPRRRAVLRHTSKKLSSVKDILSFVKPDSQE